MKKIKKYKSSFLPLLLSLFIGSAFFACDDDTHTSEWKTSKDMQILEYLEQYPDKFSSFIELSKKVKVKDTAETTFSDLLSSYGTYTVFAPTNEAFADYCKNNGYATVNDIPEKEVRGIIEYHTLMRKTKTATWENGTLKDTTVNGDKMFVDLSGGYKAIKINNKAIVIRRDEEMSNGIVHHIDHVLDPPVSTLFGTIKNDKEQRYKIMAQAIEQTDLVDTLNKVWHYYEEWGTYKRVEFTMFIESDAVFAKNGINNFSDFKKMVLEDAQKENPAITEKQAIEQYVRYHIIEKKRFTHDMSFNYKTLNKGELIGVYEIIIYQGEEELNLHYINELVIVNQKPEQSFIYENSNQLARNGVIHEVSTIIKKPKNVEKSKIVHECEKGLVFNKNLERAKPVVKGIISCSPAIEQINYYLAYDNKFSVDGDGIGKGVRFNVFDRGQWIEFNVENILAGEYAIYVKYKSNFSYATAQLQIDGKPFGNLIEMNRLGESGVMTTLVGRKIFAKDGDHKFRFVHMIEAPAVYDCIILIPVSENKQKKK